MSASQQGLPSSPDDHHRSTNLSTLDSHGDSDSDSTRRSTNHGTRHFTLRALAVGLFIGILNCVCNTYFILQSGWGSDMSMASALIGFAFFRAASPLLRSSFRREETVLIQTIADTVGLISLSCGFAGVMPALEFLLEPKEGAPMDLNLGRLILWSLGISLVGSTFAPALRQQLVVKEQLTFPTGTATAILISVLHGKSAPQSGHHLNGTIGQTDESQSLISPSQRDGAASIDPESHVMGPYIEIPKSTDTDDLGLDELDGDLGRSYFWYPLTAFIISALYVSSPIHAMSVPRTLTVIFVSGRDRCSSTQHSSNTHLWYTYCVSLALGARFVPCLYGPRRHYGPDYFSQHPSWCYCWMGYSFASSRVSGLGDCTHR